MLSERTLSLSLHDTWELLKFMLDGEQKEEEECAII